MLRLVSHVNTSSALWRGSLTGSICLGMCCLAILVTGPVSADSPKPVPDQSSAAGGPVFVDEILTSKNTRRSGFAPYKTSSVTLEGQVFPHSLMTEVGGAKPSDTLSVLTLKLDGKYERFQATVGRSDEEARNGPAYAYFEVWGDGTCFFRSSPIRSAASMVTVPTGATIRKTPQVIDIRVRGTKTLQLVTRYASTMDQQAPGISRANGCVWGDPRLLTAAVSAAPAAATLPSDSTASAPSATAATTTAAGTPAAASPATREPAASTKPVVPKRPPVAVSSAKPSVKPKTPVKTPAQASPPIRNAVESADPRRDTVRMAVLLLASGVGSATSTETPQPPQTLRYPLKIAVLPVRPVSGAQPSDAQIQKILEESLPTARRGSAALFTLLDQDGTAQLTRLFPSSLLNAIVEPKSTDILPLASFCRTRQVDAILVPTLLPGSGTTSRGGSRLDLRLFDAVNGTLLANSLQIISLPNRN